MGSNISYSCFDEGMKTPKKNDEIIITEQMLDAGIGALIKLMDFEGEFETYESGVVAIYRAMELARLSKD